jgi:GNAT superfamily N-acetyltransferase
MATEMIELISIPVIPGLTVRAFNGAADYPAMVDILNASFRADDNDEMVTVEGLANDYAHPGNCDLATDMRMVEIKGQLVAFARVWWWVNDVGERIYGIYAHVHPDWRGQGIGRALLQWQEQRAHEIVLGHPHDGSRFLQSFTMEGQKARIALLKHAGYSIIRYGFMMVRPSLADAPDEWPLPPGLEVRPVQPEHMRLIWDALNEAFRDHWGHRPSTEEDYDEFIHWPDAQPHLWQVAWDIQTNQIAGMVLNNIFPRENEQFNQKRGWTDPICVRRPWRRQGLARALIMRSLRLLREQGMTEAALGVDAENPNKALHLYESCGYEPRKRSFTWRKAM